MTETAHSPSARGNHPALRSCWHPVAYSEELGDGPVPTDLLGEASKMYFDHLSPLKRKMLLDRYRKLQRRAVAV